MAEEGSYESLLKLVKRFPKLPGVYLMRDKEGQVIYVGKAKDLRSRVGCYFQGNDERYQISFLMRRVYHVDKIVTQNEREALVLERDLITKYKPRYNIRLKDDKAFLSIRIDENADWPRLELVRKREDDGARYFGPYSFSYELRSILEIIKRVIPLRSCSNTVFYNRARPCLEYQIKRCAGPCCLAVEKGQYRDWVKQAIAILEGRVEPILKEFDVGMSRASEELRFEDAASFRDRIELLKNFKIGTSLVSSRGEARDVFQIYREDKFVVLTAVKVRDGRVIDSSNFSFSEVEVSDHELLESALTQFYVQGKEIPEEIVVPFELDLAQSIEEDLSDKRGSKVTVFSPQRGIKARLLDLALVNAREHFVATFDAESRYREIATKLSTALALKQVPRKIECIDISHFQGSDTVGAVVCFVDGIPEKSSYRHYKLSHYESPDDFASIQEVVGRRLERGLRDGSNPDLLIIDGGPGQLSMALEARDALRVELEIVALAKMRTEADLKSVQIVKSAERVYREGSEEPIELEESSEVTKFFKRVRDEAHRFVITYHRRTRAKRVFRSKLDSIPGINRERQVRLLRAFRTVEGIAAQTPEALAKAARMPLSLAIRLLSSLK